MITFEKAYWRELVNDPAMPGLWAEHYGELAGDKARMPQGVDGAYFAFLDMSGMLEIVVAKKAGVTVGYCIMLVKPHPHYRDVLCGFEDCYFLTASERNAGAGHDLIAYAEERCAARGVKRVYFMTKLSHNHSKLFEARGYELCDLVFTKWIGAEPPQEE